MSELAYVRVMSRFGATEGKAPQRIKLLPIGRLDSYVLPFSCWLSRTAAERIVNAAGESDLYFQVGQSRSPGGFIVAEALTIEPDGIYANRIDWLTGVAKAGAAGELNCFWIMLRAEKATGEIIRLSGTAAFELTAWPAEELAR